MQSPIDWFPGCTTVVSAKCTCSGDGNKDPVTILRIQNDRVQTHTAGSWLPLGSGTVAAQSGKFIPSLATIGGAKQCGILNARIDGVWVVERRLNMPNSFELPWFWCAVVELVGRKWFAGFRRRIVDKLVTLALAHPLGRRGRLAGRRTAFGPGSAAMLSPLNNLAAPAAGLRRKKAVRICRGTLNVVDLPARKMRSTHVPVFTLSI